MDAVKAYKIRKRLRLMERGYRADEDDVAEWITTENGVHIPLNDDKVAVGGALKGEEFEKSSGSTKSKKPRRKQKEIQNEKRVLLPNGRVKESCLKEFNESAFKSIVEETGYSEKEAREFHNELLDYFGGNYREFVDGKREEQKERINNGLMRMEAYDGEIYRGMSFEDYQKEAFSKFKNARVGDEIEMKTISSWSSDRNAANGFGGLNLLNGNSVVIVCKNNKSGVGVQHISKFAKKESEVLAPSTAKWKLTKNESVSRYKYLKNYYSNKSGMGTAEKERILGTIEGMKGKLSRMYVVTLEVEEI